MGMLSTAPEGHEDNPVDEGAGDDGVGESQESQAAAVQPAPEPKQRVDLPREPSRRQRAAAANDAILSELKSLREASSKTADELKAALAQRDAEIARLRGGFDALQPLVQQGQQQRQAPTGPDPDELDAKADAALETAQFAEFKRLSKQAERIRQERFQAEIMAKVQPAAQQQAPQVNPHILVLQAANPEVLAHPRGMQLVLAKDAELGGWAGMPDGPERWAKAFQLAKAQIAGQAAATQQPAQQFSQQAAGALAAVPTTSGGGARSQSRGPGVELTDHERHVARLDGMSYEEYAKYIAEAYPERVVK